MKHNFLKFLLAGMVLLGTSINLLGATTYYFRGGANSWGATKMTAHESGYYAYYGPVKGDQRFKIALKTDGWDYQSERLDKGFQYTNITNMGKWDDDNNCGIYDANNYYILIYYPNTDVNSDKTYPKICASSELPNYAKSGKTVYFDNSLYGSSTPYLRMGRNNHSSNNQMTKVSGTANLYKFTTTGTTNFYENYSAYTVANAQGSSSNIYDLGSVTKTTVHAKKDINKDITIVPTGGDTYYNYNESDGMLTHNASITAPEGGTITVSYKDINNADQSFTSGDADLAHTCILTITATPNTGYNLTSLKVNDNNFTSGQTYTLTADAVVTAEFTENLTSVTISSNGNGTVSPTSASVGVATTESVTATPADGYHFASWAVTGNAVIDGNTLSGNGNGGTGTLKATFAETLYTITIESGTAASTTAGCVTTGTATAAAAAEGKKFDKWTLGDGITLVDCAVTDQTITFHASQAATVTATYTDASKYNLNVVAGTGIENVSGSKTEQTVLPIVSEISATAKTGYTFAQWTATGEGTVSYTSGSETTANATVSVTVGSVTLTASATPNTNTPYKVYHYQQNLAGDGYDLAETEDLTGTTDAQVTPDVKNYDGFTAPSAQTVTIKGDGTTEVTYNYTRNSYDISYTPQATGWTYGTQPVSAKFGAEVSFVVTPTAGYTVTVSSSDATLDATGAPTYTFTMPAKAVEISVSASENMTAVTVSSNNTTWGTVSPASASVGVATSATLKASAKPGYKFKEWQITSGSENITLSSTSATSTTITGNGVANTEATVQAVFEEDLSCNWYVGGNDCFGGWQASGTKMSKKSGHSTEEIYYCNITVTSSQIPSSSEQDKGKIEFKLYHSTDTKEFGNPGYWVTKANHANIAISEYGENKASMVFKPTTPGTYEFKLDCTNPSAKKLTVTWPEYNCVYGDFDGWNTDTHKLNFGGSDVASTVVNITDISKSYQFLVLVNSEYFTYTTKTITRSGATNVQFVSKGTSDPNAKFTPDMVGDYTFTYNKSTNKLTITYPALPTASTTSTEKRIFEEGELSFIDSGEGTEANPYKIYTDEALTIDITALAARSEAGIVAKYQFGEEAATTDVLSKTITNPSTTPTFIVVKAFYESDGVAGTAWEKTIYYQGVPYPQLFLTSNLTNDETELDQAPEKVTISYTTENYTGTTTITKNGGAWQTATGSDKHYEEPLVKEIHADSYVATAEVNGRTFTTSLVVSVYKYVQVKVKDANPKWAKNVYMWKSGTAKKNADWPGEALTTQLGDWYIFAVKYPTYDYFVINDGKETGKQTIDLTIPAENICYQIGSKKEDKESKEIYNCESGECPNGLYVGDIANVEMYNGESMTVSPVVQLDPSLSEDDLQINFTYSAGGIVNATQSGKNIMLSATSTGTTTVTATYSINGAQSESRSFTVTVTGAVLIQVSITTSLDWNNKDEIYIKYFKHGLDSEKKMKWDHFYNGQDYFSARIPVGSDGKIDFMIHAWQIEDGHPDHQTVDVQNVSTDGCYCVLTDQESNQKRKMRAEGSLCWEEYQVKIVMGNGTTYYSNKVNNLNEIVSFYAPANNEQGYKHGNVYLTHNGVQVAAITGFTESNVYTAKVADNGLTDINVYDGPFYIRTNATSWNDYKKPDYQMNEFSLYNGAQYNYYWVGNHKSSGSFNIKGCVANQYNESLANMIETDTYTDGYGNIQNDPTLGVNLRFGYNPQTNHFERSILKGSSDNEFLNIIGDNIYNEVGCTTKLNQQDANSKFSDISNWVYEKVVYANIGGTFTEAPVKLLSKAFNGTVVYQFGYTIDPNTGQKTSTPATRSIMATGTNTGTYQLRLIYDYKTNRLTAAWSPTDNQLIENSITVNADIMFMQKEHSDATRLLMGENGKVKSLEYLLFILQIEKDNDRTGSKNNFEHYYISLPYDCMIQDIYGIEGFGEYWGIQKYDGAERARKGWFKEDTPEGFWKWMNRDEKLHGGEGYLLSVAKGWLKEDNKFSTIKDTDGKEISALRLYFPSYTKGYDLSKSSADESKEYPQQRCNITSPVDRRKEDSNWRMIGSTAYNDITTNTVTSSADDDHKLAASYLYELQQVGGVWKYVAVSGVGFTYKAFQGYMYQFEGSINWQCYTKGEEEHPASAPHYEAKRPAEKMRLSVMENETEVAHTFVELNENATKEFDFNLDLAYLASGEMDLYTEIENAHLAANVTAYESQVIALHVDPTHYNTYTFHLDGANNVAVYLLDNMNGTCQLLSAGDVTVELEEGSSGDRFALRFDVAASPTDSRNAKGETITNDGQKTQKLLINDNIYLINAGRIYNVLGARP